jgi:hypothetical protein
VEVENPFTDEKQIMVIDRAGYTEDKLSTALANPDLTRDQKDFEISMYLYQRGAHNTSMLVDLFRYKGAHTKETRVFKSQIRFDFEQFVNSFTHYLDDQWRLLGIALGVNIQVEKERFEAWLKLPNNKESTFKDFAPNWNPEKIALVEMAIHAKDEAELLRANVRKMADARMRDKGKGIYISTAGVPYTMNDPQLDDAIKADRESTAEAQKDL